MKNISCQIALYPLRKEYAEDVNAVLDQFDPGCLTVQVGMMSTLLVGPEDIVWQKARELYELGKRRGARFVLHACFSDACVKDDVCELQERQA